MNSPNTLTWDVETTIFQKGNPYAVRNKLVCVAYKWNDEPTVVTYDVQNLDVFKNLVQQADLNILFNAKFDLSWGRRYGLDLDGIRIWDCQLHRFLTSNCTEAYPSLDGVCKHYNLDSKLDVVATEYWDKGIDTDAVPRHILTEYAAKDVDLTYQVYIKQRNDFANHNQARLFSLQCQDLLTLQEMEWNGLPFDTKEALAVATENDLKIKNIEEQLNTALDVHRIAVNYSSHHHLSALLYGGKLEFEDRIVAGIYKTGAKAGQARYKVLTWTHEFPRLLEPLKGSEMAKEGVWSTDVDTFRKLKTTKKTRMILDLLTERSALMKLNGTYLTGLSDQITNMDWESDILHGQFNQCVARTGRLSSSAPNLQNIPSEAKLFIKSAYASNQL